MVRRRDMMLRYKWFLIFGALIVLALTSAGAVLALTQSQPVEPDARKTMDDRLAEAEGVVSGFGGFYLDKDDSSIAYVYMLDTSQKKGAKEALENILGPERVSREITEIRVLEGQYNIKQLKSWYDQLRETVLALAGVTSTDLNEGENRLSIGVERPEARRTVEEELARLGIPREAVIIEVEGPVKEDTHTLQSKIGLMEAGYQIQNENSLTICTLGFTTLRSSVKGIVTAHHCTPNRGGGADN